MHNVILQSIHSLYYYKHISNHTTSFTSNISLKSSITSLDATPIRQQFHHHQQQQLNFRMMMMTIPIPHKIVITIKQFGPINHWMILKINLKIQMIKMCPTRWGMSVIITLAMVGYQDIMI